MREREPIRPLRAKTMTVDGLQTDVLKVLKKSARRLRCLNPHLKNVTDAEFVDRTIEPLISAIETDRVYRNRITDKEITAAEREKFEAWVKENTWAENMTERDQTWGYATLMIHWCWKAWCQAVGCDPKGDFQ